MAFFVTQGLLSRRFLAVLLCRGGQRRATLLEYARHENEPDPVDGEDASEEERLSSEDSEEEGEDPEAGRTGARPQTPTQERQRAVLFQKLPFSEGLEE